MISACFSYTPPEYNCVVFVHDDINVSTKETGNRS